MRTNRNGRRTDRKLAKAMVRSYRPNASFLTWPKLRLAEPAVARDFENLILEMGGRHTDVLIYEDKGQFHLLFPSEMAA